MKSHIHIFLSATGGFRFAQFLIFLLTPFVSFCQDTIVQKNGVRIISKVLEIDKIDVKYKKFENLDGPSYVISKSDVNFIIYKNGSVDTLSVAEIKVPVMMMRKPPTEMFLRGQHAADTFYTAWRKPQHWALGSTLALNVFGIFPSIVMTTTDVKKENLGTPDMTLMNNEEYAKGYSAGAKQIKGNHVMKGFGIGALGSVVLYGALIMIIKH
jgi:hypothetical protein